LRHGLFLTSTGEATPFNRAAKQSIVWQSFDCRATGVPNRIAFMAFFHLGDIRKRRGFSGLPITVSYDSFSTVF